MPEGRYTGALPCPLPLPSPPPPALSPSPDLSLASADGGATIRTLTSFLPPAATLPARTGLERRAREFLGEEISMEFDLAPLLQNAAFLALSRSASDARLRFLLMGEERPAILLRTVDRFHASVKAGLSSHVIRRRDLPEGYVSTTIEDDPTLAEEREERREGWSVRVTRRTDTGEGLWSAVSGDRFLFTNDERWLMQILRAPAPSLPLPAARGITVAGGSLRRSFLQDALRGILEPVLPATFLEMLGIEGDRLVWTVGQDGDVTTVTVEMQK